MSRRSTIREQPPLLVALSDVVSVFDGFHMGACCVDLAGRFTYVSPAGEAFLGYGGKELLGRGAHEAIHHSRPDGSAFPAGECPVSEAVRQRTAMTVGDDVFWRQDGSPLPVVRTIAPLYDQGEHSGAIVVFGEISERDDSQTERLRSRAERQAAISELGLTALGGGGLPALFARAAELAAVALQVEFSQILELDVGAGCLRLRAGVGWRPGAVENAVVGLEGESPAGLAVACDQPVLVEDMRRESRFRVPALLVEHGVLSGASVVIPGRDQPWGSQPWGVLSVHSSRSRSFTADDIGFLSSMANIVALAIDRTAADGELHERNEEILDLARRARSLADDRRRILTDALGAEDRARELISQALHDEALQSLLSVRQDLAKARGSGAGRSPWLVQVEETVTAAIRELRSAVVALHPVTLEQGGLLSAISATAALHGRRGHFTVSLDLDPGAAGPHDHLIVSLIQELLNNVVNHARASQVTITLRRGAGEIICEVADDGRGLSRAQVDEAVGHGHIGLASAELRAEAAGGRFKIGSRKGGGARIRAVLPVDAPRPA